MCGAGICVFDTGVGVCVERVGGGVERGPTPDARVRRGVLRGYVGRYVERRYGEKARRGVMRGC